jgi:hypothetical protein
MCSPLARWFLAWLTFILRMETIRSSETSLHIRNTRRYVPEDGGIPNHRFENLKSYIHKMLTKFQDLTQTSQVQLH